MQNVYGGLVEIIRVKRQGQQYLQRLSVCVLERPGWCFFKELKDLTPTVLGIFKKLHFYA
jgi:hypothetical protein